MYPYDSIARYIDFPKFFALINKKALFFPKILELEDPLEGILPNSRAWKVILASQQDGLDSFEFDKLKDFTELVSRKTFVNCWHYNHNESEGMWKLYSASGGVAIISTLEKLKSFAGYSLFDEQGFDIKISDIEYLDNKVYEEIFNLFNDYVPDTSENILERYEERTRNLFNEIIQDYSHFFFKKRDCYEHEKELRVIITPRILNTADFVRFSEVNNIEQYVPVDSLDGFIDKIIISPYAPAFYKETIIGILEKHSDPEIKKLSAKVMDSEIRVFNEKISDYSHS